MTESPNRSEIDRAMSALAQQLELWQQAGVDAVPAELAELARRFWEDGWKRKQEETGAGLTLAAAALPRATSPPVSVVSTESARGMDRMSRGAFPLGESDASASSISRAHTVVGEQLLLQQPSGTQEPRRIGDPYPPPVPVEERPGQLRVLAAEVAACMRCDELVRHRTQTVFGVGNPQPRVCFLGEAPGAEEDRQGEPFVGAAGQLLNKIIVASKMSRQEVYILNTIKCRPPGNRNPTDTEMGNCFHFAQRQLEILQPEFIVCLGGIAARGLLGTKLSIARLRGQFHYYRGSRVIVTYHPAFLLRDPRAKHHVWEDMKMLMREMGLPVP